MQKLNIYIVEDEAILATLLKYTLQNLGHRVCGVADCYTDAVKYLSKTDVDLVITDIMIKGNETGIDIARYIKDNLDVPFMFLSSIMDEDMINDARSTGPVSYLKKPVNRESLNQAINVFAMANIPGTGPSSN